MSTNYRRGNSASAEYAYAQAGATRNAPPQLRWPARVLAVESSGILSRDGRSELLHHGIELCVYADGLSALLGFGDEQPSVVVAPTDMTGVDLVDFVSAVTAWSQVPIIVGLGREEGANEHAYRGLEQGARSLIALPFRGPELSTALRTLGVVATGGSDSAARIAIGPLSLDPQAFVATIDGKPLVLTPREFHVLKYLMTQAHRVVSPEELSEQHSVYGDANVEGTRVVVLRIRRKLDAASPGASAMLQTLRGIGYRIIEPAKPL